MILILWWTCLKYQGLSCSKARRQHNEIFFYSDANIPKLFAVANRNIKDGKKIVPFYIWVEEESGGQEPEVTEHEQRLINEYKAREAVEAVQVKSKSSSSGNIFN